MSTIDQQFVEFVIKAIVNHPDDVKVEREVVPATQTRPDGSKMPDRVNLQLTVHPEDVGRVIGRHGDTAKSMRTLLMALGTKNELFYYYKINDNGEERGERRTETEEKPAKKTDQASDTKKTVAEKKVEKEPETAVKEAVSEEKASEKPLVPETEEKVEDEVEDFAAKHRQDLKDLDDIDI